MKLINCPHCGTKGAYIGFKEIECVYWACQYYSEKQDRWLNEQEQKEYEEMQMDGPEQVDYAD